MGYKMSGMNCNSLYDRVNKLLVSYEWSDCCFDVFGKKFKAHKLILGISSPVFEAMFYGPLASNDDICITDVEPEIFQLMLNYIYTDKVEISSIEEAFELLYVSRKYLLEHLSEICVSFVQSNMTVDNVITILNYPDHMHDHKLLSASLKLVCEHASYILQENLEHISINCMRKILQCNSMNIKEKQLIKYVFKWTLYQCTQNCGSEIFERRRSIMINNDLFKLLRFATLSLNELHEVITDDNYLLLPFETHNVRHTITDPNCTSILHYFEATGVTRNPIKLQWRLCHRSPLRSMSPAIIEAHNNSIQTRLKVNKSVFINSFSVPSRMTPEVNFYNNTNAKNIYREQFTVSVVGENGNSIINNLSINANIEYDSNLDVELSQPLFIKNDQWYTINLVWPRRTTDYSYSYAVQRRETSFNNRKIEFQFEDVPLISNNGGSFLKGLTFCL